LCRKAEWRQYGDLPKLINDQTAQSSGNSRSFSLFLALQYDILDNVRRVRCSLLYILTLCSLYFVFGRDSAHNNEQKLMILSLDKFLCRFLLHILPQGFVRIRNFGFPANRRRAALLPLCFSPSRLSTTAASRTKRLLHQRLFRSLALPEVRWPDEGYRAAYRCRNPTPRAASGHRGSMKALSPIRILRVPRHGSHFFALPSNNSLLPASPSTFFTILFHRNETPHARCHVVHPGARPWRTSTPSHH
jgi:hypothetical protein